MYIECNRERETWKCLCEWSDSFGAYPIYFHPPVDRKTSVSSFQSIHFYQFPLSFLSPHLNMLYFVVLYWWNNLGSFHVCVCFFLRRLLDVREAITIPFSANTLVKCSYYTSKYPLSSYSFFYSKTTFWVHTKINCHVKTVKEWQQLWGSEEGWNESHVKPITVFFLSLSLYFIESC